MPKSQDRIAQAGQEHIVATVLETWKTSELSNGELYLNSVAFLAAEMDQLGESAAARSQHLTLSGVQTMVLLLVGVLLVPGGCALLGIILLVRRRFL